MLAGDQAAARQALDGSERERLQVIARLTVRARLLADLAESTADPASAQALTAAVRSTLSLVERLQASLAEPIQAPAPSTGAELPTATATPTPTQTATATATASPTATASQTPPATAAWTATLATPTPSATSAAGPRPRQTTLAQTALPDQTQTPRRRRPQRADAPAAADSHRRPDTPAVDAQAQTLRPGANGYAEPTQPRRWHQPTQTAQPEPTLRHSHQRRPTADRGQSAYNLRTWQHLSYPLMLLRCWRCCGGHGAGAGQRPAACRRAAGQRRLRGGPGLDAASAGGYNLISQFNPRTGHWGAYLAGANNADDRLSQPLALPADAISVTLRLWWSLESEEPPVAADTLTLSLLRPNGAGHPVARRQHTQGSGTKR